MQRRTFLAGGAGGLAALFAGAGGYRLGANRTLPEYFAPAYGTLRRAGEALALPPGFQHRELSREGEFMSDGQPTPPLPDGMAAFALPNGNVRLIRNHEIETDPVAGFVHDPTTAYDTNAWGSVTSLEVDPRTREVVRDFVVLAGTTRNCSGGSTPWGSWLSCEEWMFGPAEGMAQPHGYVFEVPASAEGPVKAEPLRGLGRFFHEAVAVCPTIGVVYETEDFDTVPFYRWVPERAPARGQPIDLKGPGMLQTLVVSSEPGIDLTEAVNVGATWNTEWVTIDDPDPPFDPTREQAESGGMLPPVAAQGFEQGAAVFRRLEGCCTEDGVVWFTSTNGGRGHGQVWRYSPRDIDGGELTLAFVSPAESVLSGPDNLCVSPAGSIVMCEDTEREPNRVVALTTTGLIVPLVENIGDDEEFAGVTFSPDGETMFVNVMGDRDDGLLGRTFAVWGPWHLGPV